MAETKDKLINYEGAKILYDDLRTRDVELVAQYDSVTSNTKIAYNSSGTEYEVPTIDEFNELSEDISNITDTVIGSNVLNPSDLQSGLLLNTSTGETSSSASFTTLNYTEIGANSVFSCGFNPSSQATVRYCLYDTNKQFLNGGNMTFTQARVKDGTVRHYAAIQTSGSAKYVRICISSSIWNNSSLKPMIENTSTAILPYTEYIVPKTEINDTALPTVSYSPNGGDIVVFVGDSITGNYSTPNDYPSLISKKLGIEGLNGGFGGCRMSLHTDTDKQPFSFCSLVDAITSGDFSTQYAKYGKIAILNLYEHTWNLDHADWSNVKYLVVFFGTNDWTAQVPIDNEDNPKDTSTYIGAFRYGYEKLMATYPNIKVIAVAPMYRYDADEDWDTETKTFGGKYIYDFGDALIAECKKYHIGYIDMYRESGVNAYTRENFIEDGTHPTANGLSNLANIIGGKILVS